MKGANPVEEIISEISKGEGTIKWGDSPADSNSKRTVVGRLIENVCYSVFSTCSFCL
jgi:hypothetical protein